MGLCCLFALAGRSQFRPDDLEGLALWLRSDTLVTASDAGKVNVWGNAAGGEGATQTAGSLAPNIFEDVLAGYPSIRFSGGNDFMYFPDQDNIHTVFVVCAEMADVTGDFRPVLGHSTVFDFHRGPDDLIWHPEFAHPGILEGTTRLNFTEIDGTTTTYPHAPSLLSLQSEEPLRANQLSVDRNLFVRVWGGDWFELIIYDWVLSEEEVAQVENYLADRYMPAFTPLEDVITFSFCDSTICAPDGFAEYLWNGQPGDQCYTTTDSEALSLTVIDDFGRASGQTINVTYPGVSLPDSPTICSGETLLLESGLDTDTYTVAWLDDSPETSQVADQTGTYGYTATDVLGCSVTRSTFVDVDDFGLLDALPDTTSLCAGNTLTSDVLDFTALDAIWDGEAGPPALPVFSSTWHVLEVINPNGCLLQDSTYADILGVAPTPIAATDAGCQGDPVTFTDQSTGDSPMAAWVWTVNGEQVSTEASFEVPVDLAGDVAFGLTVTTEAGCTASMDSTVNVRANPVIELALPQVCRGVDFALQPQITVPGGEVGLTYWDVEGTLLQQEVYLGSWGEAGLTNISLQVYSTAGCSTTLDTVVDVLPAPDLNFVVPNPRCEGALLEFNSYINCEGCEGDLTYNWDFGDGTFSSQEDPTHFYIQAGSYEVTFSAATENGCVATSTNPNLVVSPYPDEVSYTSEQLCSGTSVVFTNTTPLGSGNTSYGWSIPGASGGWTSGATYTAQFPAGGTYTLTQTVAYNWCATSVTSTLEVTEGPDPAFVMEAVQAPYTYTLVPVETEGIHQWTIDGNDPLATVQPTWTFEDADAVDVWHQIEAETGCIRSAELTLTPDSIFTNLIADAVFATPNGVGQQVVDVQVANASSHPVYRIRVQLGTDGDAGLEEEVAVNIPAGEAAVVRLAQLLPGEYAGMVCATVNLVQTAQLVETNLEDNRTCNAADGQTDLLSLPYPNPATDALHLDVVLDTDASEFSALLIDGTGREVREWEGALNAGHHQLTLDLQGIQSGQYTLVVRRFDEVWEAVTVLVARPGE